MTERAAKRARTEGNEKDAHQLQYLQGISGFKTSEARPGAVPKGQANPRRCPYDLYAEKFSGSAFTVPRNVSLQTWLYRTRPSVQHSLFVPAQGDNANEFLIGDFSDKTKAEFDPNQMRWMPLEIEEDFDFIQGLRTVGGSGSAEQVSGYAVHLYTATKSMPHKSFMNADGDFLIVPQQGTLHITTEFGILRVEPCEICVIVRGMRFSVDVSEPSRGYILEVFGRHFTLPELGPIGSHGLANAGDFFVPTAAFDGEDKSVTLLHKLGGKLFQAEQSYSPYNVVGWAGSCYPYKYDLRRFMCINSVTYDHPDPSIYTVLTCQSDSPGTAIADFVIFPPRWMPQMHTFRPPWYHRNVMAEYMGMIWGAYDAKGKGKDKKSAFVPGGGSLHNSLSPHGPDTESFDKAMSSTDEPHLFEGGLAFMFESYLPMKVTQHALHGPHRDQKYHECWASLPHRLSDWLPEDGDNLMTWNRVTANGK